MKAIRYCSGTQAIHRGIVLAQRGEFLWVRPIAFQTFQAGQEIWVDLPLSAPVTLRVTDVYSPDRKLYENYTPMEPL